MFAAVLRAQNAVESMTRVPGGWNGREEGRVGDDPGSEGGIDEPFPTVKSEHRTTGFVVGRVFGDGYYGNRK